MVGFLKPLLLPFLPVGLVAALLLQADLIPDSAWAQYPIVILFIGTFVLMARYHLAEQDKWRQSYRDLVDVLRSERSESQKALEESLREQRQAQVELITMLQTGSREFFETFSRVQGQVFEEAIEKISGNYYALVYEGQKAQEKEKR